MLNADVLTFQEFVAHETLPLSQIHSAVLEFLQGREDVVLIKDGETASLSVPNHKEVAKGVLRSLIGAANLTLDEFVNAI